MITVVITPLEQVNLHGMLVKKELDLRRRNTGTLHAKGSKKRNDEKWTHVKYDGWIRFSGSLAGTVVAVIRSKKPEAEGDLLATFLSFLHRHFSGTIASINVIYAIE